MRAWPGIVGGLLAVLLVAGCGLVPHPEEQARELATDRVRDEAAGFGTSLWAGLRATDAADAREVVRFRDQADAGGGLSYAQAVVQLCVRVTGTPGPGGQVRLADLACPASLAMPGLVDHQVTLAEEGPPPAPEPPRPACHSGGDNRGCPGG